MDLVMETTINRYYKSVGGLSGKTENIGASNKCAILNHYLCLLKEHINHKIRKNKINYHVELGSRRVEKDEKDVSRILDGLKQWIPNIYSPNQPLFNIYSGIPASPELVENAKTLISRGKESRDDFF